jgi:hypothetical protein
MRVVQLTPAGSARSIGFGTGITQAPSAPRRACLVVPDILAARAELTWRGEDVGEVRHLERTERRGCDLARELVFGGRADNAGYGTGGTRDNR